MPSLLSLEHISKRFPGVQALTDISLQLHAGEIHALLGENGAGKSTLMKILSGIHAPDSGSIAINGQPMRFHTYHDAISAGIGIIFQEFSLIPSLSAPENIFLGRERSNRFGWLDTRFMRDASQAIFQRLGVQIDLTVPVEALSVAQQQFVEIAKALALDTRILILDEPTATLTPAEAEQLFLVMRQLKAQGVGMIFISHHMEEIYAICDRITVLRDGCKVATCEVDGTGVDELVQMMVGRTVEQSYPAKAVPDTDRAVVMAVQAIQLHPRAPVNRFDLHKGEILGFAGLVGSGRTELVMGLLGAQAFHYKDVRVEGRPAALKSPADALACGIGLLPECRKTEGLILPFSIRENITLNNLLKHCGRSFIIDRRGEGRLVDELMRSVQVKAPDHECQVSHLSGGSQQKVVIARWLNHACKVLVFDEPTRGIDVGAKAEIYRLMRALTTRGVSIIVVSSDLPEVVGLSDRVAVFRHGEIVTTLSGAAVTSNQIMRYATGAAHHEQRH